MRQWVDGVRLRGLSIALLTTGAIGWSGVAWAQNITLDGTLGPQRTLTGPVYQIRQQDGRSIGSNLFHSFGRFNLLTGEQANFASSAAIRNILARVTGGARSEIDGLIATQSRAVNLFLINPSGILFGPNARLDVGSSQRGSFVATTTDALVWPDGSHFNARTPNNGDSLLRIVGDPSGFMAARRNLRPIEIRGTATQQTILGIYPGNSLVLVGGGINVENALLSWYIPAAGGLVDGIHIGIAGIAEAGILGLNVSGNQLSLQVPDELPRADVLIEKSTLFSRAGNSGSISVYANNLNLLNGTQLLAGIDSDSGSTRSQSGDITLNVLETLVITGNSFVYNDVNTNSIGNGGNVNITAGSLTMNGGVISADTLGQGNSGKVNIDVKDSMILNTKGTQSAILNNVLNGATGNSGGIHITTGSLILDGSNQISNTLYYPSLLFSIVRKGG